MVFWEEEAGREYKEVCQTTEGVNRELLFTLPCCTAMVQHSLKLLHLFGTGYKRKHIFTQQVLDTWPSLSQGGRQHWEDQAG